MKRIVYICIVLLFASSLSIYGKDFYELNDMQKMHQLFQERDKKYRDYILEEFSEEVWKKHGLLVTKENALKNKYVTKNVLNKDEKFVADNKNRALFRYLGTTPEDYVVENPDYPADTPKINQFHTFSWTMNSNHETSLLRKLDKLEETDREIALDFYWNLIDSSFTREYANYYHSARITPQIKQDILNAGILVYPFADTTRHLLSFRNTKGKYEVTASTERGDKKIDLPQEEVTETTVPSRKMKSTMNK